MTKYVIETTGHECVTKDEIKDTTKTQGTNEYKHYFLSWPYTGRTFSLSYEVNDNHTFRVFFYLLFFTESTSS